MQPKRELVDTASLNGIPEDPNERLELAERIAEDVRTLVDGGRC